MEFKDRLLAELEDIHTSMLQAEQQHSQWIGKALPNYRDSAINLIDYLALRSRNIEALQVQLHSLGLSSLASSESHIKCQVVRIIERLRNKLHGGCGINAESGLNQLARNIKALLGTAEDDPAIPVMVTFDKSFAGDDKLLCDLLQNGMRIARINCAHDDRDTWMKMIRNLNKAREKMNLPCKLYMDLPGPKARTQVVTKKHKRGKLKVSQGDRLMLTDLEHLELRPKKYIRCSLTGIIENLKPGQRIFFDDGLFEAEVESLECRTAIIRITRVAAKKPFIRTEKGINFPDTEFSIKSLTDYDRKCLAFIVTHADMVGFSFLNSAADLQELQKELAELGKSDFPIVAKIETKKAVEHLPEIILQGMQQGLLGIMVARGDMALEIGFERMSEIQDEILWIGEAAHTPVIWATQVLENLQKKGIATRGEITDAAHAARADCVLINKGDFIIEVLKTLNSILKRSRKNVFKNRRLFRELSIASRFIKPE